MGLENFLKQTAKEVDHELELLLPKKISDKDLVRFLGVPEFEFHLGASQKAIVDPIWDFLGRGGKRWRPALMLLACQAVGGKKEDVLPLSVIPELVHNGTIVVDDVEDSSTLRRGKPALHVKFGIDVAINAGNAMYYLPLVPLFSSKLAIEKKQEIYETYFLEMIRLSFGQAMDIQWHNGGKKVSEKQYLQMCSYKTGSLSRMAVKLGAILGGASKEQLDCFCNFATSLGVAFQIQDDVLNVRPPKNWGKEIGDDIREGKRTIIVINAFSVLPKEKKKCLEEILNAKKNSSKEVKEAISYLEESGAIDYSVKYAKKLVLDNWVALDKVLQDSEYKMRLKEFADYVVERKI